MAYKFIKTTVVGLGQMVILDEVYPWQVGSYPFLSLYSVSALGLTMPTRDLANWKTTYTFYPSTVSP